MSDKYPLFPQDLLAENVQLKKKIQDLYDMRNRP